MPRDLPTGAVTFLLTDVEGSTKLLADLGADAYSSALADHRRILRTAFRAHGGIEVDTQGDALFVAFADAAAALEAADEAQRALAAGPIRVRMGIHTGTPKLAEEGYVGMDVHRAARIAAAGHGGQVLLSRETRELVDGAVELTDLGEHRVKDFAKPVWIYQLGTERFPALKTISNTNLPRPAGSFVGREREVAEIGALLNDGIRLLTLTGPGGTGKTRLAIEAAAELVPAFPNGVFWVGLSALRDPGLVPGTIGKTIGANDGLAAHIGEREMLLLLDNLEQVVAAAPDLASLVEACPNLRLLATSRERLRVRGEREYAVPPLATEEAVMLFCELANVPADETIAELCQRLDDLPLAVELAAARTSVLSPAQILERVSRRLDLLKGGRDAEARQRTLRATIEWSHDLLTPEEQTLFARLSVFRGGCTLEAAEVVVDADLDTLQSLIDKSLLRQRDERFSVLETIRDFAIERLKDSGEANDLHHRHAEYFLALAEEAGPHAERGDAASTVRLDAEEDNFRAALDRSESWEESPLALRLAGALVPFWRRVAVAEGRHRLERLLSRDEQPNGVRAKALAASALLARQSGDPATARHRAGEARSLYRDLGEAQGNADATLTLGLAFADEGDFSRARELFGESVELFRGLGDEVYALFASRLLAWMYEELGDRERAWALYDHNLGWARALGNKAMEGQTLGAVAGMALDQGRTEDAVSMLKDVLRIDRELHATLQTANDLTRFARALAFAGGRDADAAALLSSAEALREKMGAGGMPYLMKSHDEALAVVRNRLGEAAIAYAWMKGAKLSADEAAALALGESDVDA
jgi:predicted ATPase/class 3 adenylate cyclase